MKIYVSPSQQVNNIGYGNYGSESKRCFEIARALEPILQRCGFVVYTAPQGITFQAAVKESNKYKCDLHICIHTNAFNGKTRGTLGMYASEEGKKLTTSIYNKLSKFTPTADLGVRRNLDLFELNKTYAVASYIEVAFHDNKEDASLITLNIEAIASLIARGVCEYAKVPYVERIDPIKIAKYQVIAGTFSSRANAEARLKEVIDAKIEGYILEVK
jgi:N-acetylmuramoyl-L-alanine amidase